MDTPSSPAVAAPKRHRLTRIILLALAAMFLLVVVFAGIVAMQPSDFRVTRSTSIAAPPEVVFGNVNDLHKWEQWNPWGKLDPTMVSSYDGPPEGTGAIHKWVGNSNVGEGQMTILESRPNELVRIQLDFFKPMPGTSHADFTFQPKAGQTEITWDMTGKNSFLAKAFCMFMDMDQMIGDQFEIGLSDLKAVSEKSAQ